MRTIKTYSTRAPFYNALIRHLINRPFFIILEEMAKREYLSNFELIVMLALMRLHEDAYGVTVSREIEEQIGREVARASVYAVLERLESKGFVSSELGEPTPERGGRAKRYFHISAKGLREVHKTRRALTKLWKGFPQPEGRTA